MTTSRNLQSPDDEMLIAYVDGELDADKSAEVEAFLATSPEARELVDRLRRATALAAEAFDLPQVAGGHDAIAAMILNHPTASEKSSVIAMKPRGRPTWMASPVGLPLAASIALVAGMSFGYMFAKNGAEPDRGSFNVAVGTVSTANPLRELLEKAASGSPVNAGADDAHELIVTATYRDRNKRICREFELSKPSDHAQDLTVAFACRGKDNMWQVEAATRIAAVTGGGTPDGFNPAGSEMISPIETMLKAVGAGSALSSDEERALLKSGWAE